MARVVASENASPALEASEATWEELGELQQFASPGPHGVATAEHQLVVVSTPNGPACLAGRCPHQGALLSEGSWDGKTLTCPNHGWCFDENGQRLDGTEHLEVFPTRVQGGKLWAQLPQKGAGEERKDSLAPPSGERPVLRTIQQLPHPPFAPIVGNAFQLPPDTLHLRLESWAEEYGCPYHSRVGNMNFVTIDDPETIDFVHRSRPHSFRRFERIEPVFKELGAYGVFAAEGGDWQKQRRLAVTALALRNQKAFYGTIARVTERLFRRWQSAAREATEIDLLAELMLFTVDVTSSLAFGHDSNTVENPDDRIQKYLGLIFPSFERRLTAVFPYWHFIRFPKDRALDRAILALDEWIEQRVQETYDRFDQDPELEAHPQNFLEAMIAMRREKGQPFDRELIKANILTMLLAGEDTTAGAVAWTIHEALEHPDVTARLANEAREVMGEKPFPDSVEQAGRLRYALAALNETLRLRPVVPMQSFTAIEDTTLQGALIPKGTHVTALMRRASTRPQAGGSEFSPERFLNDEFAPVLKSRGINIPFGSGPRVCPGRSLAQLEARILLGLVYKNFEVERVGDYADVTEHMSFTMAPRGLKVRLRERRS